jgi:hypothetical protein
VFCDFPEVPSEAIGSRVMSGEEKSAVNDDVSLGHSAVVTTKRSLPNLVHHFLVRQPGFRILGCVRPQ